MSFYVTTPIYYVNAMPHLGHAYTTIAADVIARYQRLMGEDTYFLTGTDEHGTKIQEAADANGIDVKEFVDQNSQRFRDLLPLLNAQNDFFVRTTDPEHKAFVQATLAKLYENGDIYQDTYSGLYCTACEAYYTSDDLIDGELCPDHKKPVTHMEETNWFFKLSAYQERLIEYFKANPDWIQPRSRYNEALSFIKRGLEDLSISRSSISWGIQVPWDAEQVFYVWIDALFNYRSALTYADSTQDLGGTYWPPKLQILGKDILKFHGVIWPALLMASDLELPEKMLVHGYLTSGGDKMSKSIGNVFDPFPVIEQHGADPVRFYVLREVNLGQDGDVSMTGYERRYDGELANDLGNLVSRTASMLIKYRGDGEQAAVPGSPAESIMGNRAATMIDRWKQQMDIFDLSGALETIWVYVRDLNRHVEDRAPWKLAKDESASQQLDETLGELIEGICAVAHTLTPVMPETSAKIADVFGISESELAKWQWGIAEGRSTRKPAPLFPRLETTSSAS